METYRIFVFISVIHDHMSLCWQCDHVCEGTQRQHQRRLDVAKVFTFWWSCLLLDSSKIKLPPNLCTVTFNRISVKQNDLYLNLYSVYVCLPAYAPNAMSNL